jgi:hypothetical protein
MALLGCTDMPVTLLTSRLMRVSCVRVDGGA